jgi:hypothetical protein
VAGQQLSAEHQPRAKPGTDREEREVLDPARDAPPALADGGEVDVVGDLDGPPEPLRQLR